MPCLQTTTRSVTAAIKMALKCLFVFMMINCLGHC